MNTTKTTIEKLRLRRTAMAMAVLALWAWNIFYITQILTLPAYQTTFSYVTTANNVILGFLWAFWAWRAHRHVKMREAGAA